MRNSSNEPVFVAELSLIKKVSNLYDVTLIVNTKDDFEHGNDNKELLNHFRSDFSGTSVTIIFKDVPDINIFYNLETAKNSKPMFAYGFEAMVALVGQSTITFQPQTTLCTAPGLIVFQIKEILSKFFGAIVTE